MTFSHVHSIRDIDYEITPNTCYHPAFLSGAIQRIQNGSVHSEVKTILSEIMNSPAAAQVWSVVIEKDRRPVFVLKNLALAKTSLPYRRVLRVSL